MHIYPIYNNVCKNYMFGFWLDAAAHVDSSDMIIDDEFYINDTISTSFKALFSDYSLVYIASLTNILQSFPLFLLPTNRLGYTGTFSTCTVCFWV